MTENGVDLVLDGNAAARLLQEIFVLDITTAQIQCEACGSTGAVGVASSAAPRRKAPGTMAAHRRRLIAREHSSLIVLRIALETGRVVLGAGGSDAAEQ
jgi:hypothetical protein